MPENKKIVTFLIGNGFDVGMGMKSQYADFYRVFTDPDSSYYPQTCDYLARKIASDQDKREDHWSYYEKWFGELTKKGPWGENIQPDDLLQLNEEFQEHFYKYLREQEAGLFFSMDNGKIKKSLLEWLGRNMVKALRDFYDEKNKIDGAEQIQSVLKPGGQNPQIEYQFVCYNYSSVLDQCVDAAKASQKAGVEGILAKAREARASGKEIILTESEVELFAEKGGEESFRGIVNFYAKMENDAMLRSYLERQGIQIGSVHHGHGELKEPDQTVLVMGVNDDGQVGEAFRSEQNGSHSSRLTKRNIMISNSKSKQLDTTMAMIKQSDIIVVYGMSIGDTDQDYWKELYSWLKEKEDRHLVFFIFDKRYEPLHPNQRSQIVGEKTKEFREMTWRIDGEWKRCEKKNQTRYFKETLCPQSASCTNRKCNAGSLKEWCQKNGLGNGAKNCKELDCPYRKTYCDDWRRIRKQIHFAIHQNIFEYDLVRSDYYPAMMYLLILKGILKDDGNGTWTLEGKEIAKLDSSGPQGSGDPLVKAGLKLYVLFDKLLKSVEPEDLEAAAERAGSVIDTSGEAYQKGRDWLKEELKSLKEFRKTAKGKKGKSGGSTGQTKEIDDFYKKIQKWELLLSPDFGESRRKL